MSATATRGRQGNFTWSGSYGSSPTAATPSQGSSRRVPLVPVPRSKSAVKSVEEEKGPRSADRIVARKEFSTGMSGAGASYIRIPSALTALAKVDRPTTPRSDPNPLKVPSLSLDELRHRFYLSRVSLGKEATIARGTAIVAEQLWQLVSKESQYRLPVPAACTGSDGEMFYAWDRGRHHLEAEIIPGQDVEFFYRDRETGQFWAEDYRPGDKLPSLVVAALTLFS